MQQKLQLDKSVTFLSKSESEKMERELGETQSVTF
jgi:hypothetical protein